MEFVPRNNTVTIVDSLTKFTSLLPFFIEGLSSLNDPNQGRGNMPERQFVQLLLSVMVNNTGAIFVIASKNGKALGYAVLREDTDYGAAKSYLVYALYSNGKCATAVDEIQEFFEQWATKQGAKKLHAFSRRVNGSAIRWFQRKRHFTKVGLIFEKEL